MKKDDPRVPYHAQIKEQLTCQLASCQKKLRICSTMCKEGVAIKLDFTVGGTSNMGLGMLAVRKEPSGRTVTIAHAIYAEKWTQHKSNALNSKNKIWEDPKMRQFLWWKLLQG